MQFKGVAYRAHNPYWSFSPTSGEGAKSQGGGFNPKGVSALYLSLTAPTALAEYNQGFPHRPQPLTLCAYEVNCENIMNLMDRKQRKKACITLSDMASAWELMVTRNQTPPTWEMANKLSASGVAGIIVPSYAKNAPKDGQNIIFWDWHVHPPHKVELIDDNNLLPKNQKSWMKTT